MFSRLGAISTFLLFVFFICGNIGPCDSDEKFSGKNVGAAVDEDEKHETIEEINSRSSSKEHKFEFDMILTRSQAADMEKAAKDESITEEREKRQTFRNDSYPDMIWKRKRVPYYFSRSANDNLKKEFRRAAKAWEIDTCINFTQISENENKGVDHLEITTNDGCSSHVGRLGGWQPLSLVKGCENFGHIAHELGHALGLFHTMGRHDRNRYIKLNRTNMHPNYTYEFVKQTRENNRNYGLGYDYGSIMHYGWKSASHNKQPTMVPKDTNYNFTLGSEMISFIDLTLINIHYKCYGNCKNVTTATCFNGGYPHPRNCSRCLCPGGYGGRNCTERPSGCGQTLNATADWSSLHSTTPYHNPDLYLDGYLKCNYWIESPQNTTIEVKIVNVQFDTHDDDGDACVSGGVEVKTNRNHTLTGYRFCSLSEDDGDNPITLVSNSSRVPIIVYNRKRFAGVFNVQYRYVDASRSQT